MSKLLKNFVGIDISKTYFDVVVVKTQPTEEMIHHQFPQKQEGFLKMLEWLQQHNVTLKRSDTFLYGIHRLVQYRFSKLPGKE